MQPGQAQMKVVCYCVLIVLGTVYAQELDTLTVTFKKAQDQSAILDQVLKFVCEINRKMAYLLNNNMSTYIVRQSAVEDHEVILTEDGRYIEAEKDYYKVGISLTRDNGVIVKFDLLKVRELDEGTLMCRLNASKDQGAEIIGEDKQIIEILKPLDVLHLKFANLTGISKSIVHPVEVNSSKYTVACIAEGSNPASTVRLYLNDSLVQNVTNKTDVMDTKLKKWRTTVTGTVRITFVNSEQKFKCEAESQLGDKHSVELPFKIDTYDPEISCNSTEACIHQQNITLTCLIDYEISDIEGFKYECGDNKTSEVMSLADVYKEQLTDTKFRVHLKLKKAEECHFQKEFYLNVIHKDGHETRENVRLEKISGPCDSSSNLSPPLPTFYLLICALCLWRTLL